MNEFAIVSLGKKFVEPLLHRKNNNTGYYSAWHSSSFVFVQKRDNT